MGKAVCPRPDQALADPRQPFEQPGNRVRVPVHPASDRVDRALDGGEVLADRAVLPVRVAPLMGEPGLDIGRRLPQAVEPRLSPRVADDGRIGRRAVPDVHERGPGQRVHSEQAAAHVVDVVGIAVVCGAERDHRLQCGRAAGCDLEAVEAAPGDPEHAHGARAPGLGRDPGDGLDSVVQLLFEVLVEEDPVRLAGSAQVDAHAGVPVPGEVGVHGGVAPPGPVVLPVGDVLEDRWHRLGLGALGKPDLRGQAASIGHRNPDVLDLAHLAREVRANPHASPSHGAVPRV